MCTPLNLMIETAVNAMRVESMFASSGRNWHREEEGDVDDDEEVAQASAL